MARDLKDRDSARNAPWRPPPASRWLERQGAGFRQCFAFVGAIRHLLYLGQHPADVSGLLRCHAAMLVEFDRRVRQRGTLASMRCASERSTELIEIITIAE